MMAEDMKFAINNKPVAASAVTKVHQALQKTLQDQLAAESKTLGHDPGKAAIHGMTGVSSKQLGEET
jgi:hypothetical protein